MYTGVDSMFNLYTGSGRASFPGAPAKNGGEKDVPGGGGSPGLTVVSVALLLVSYGSGSVAELTLLTLTKAWTSLSGWIIWALFPGVYCLDLAAGGIFSVEYLHHEHHKRRFWGFYLLTLCALQGLSLAETW